MKLKANGQTLLYQLKHSIRAAPPPIMLMSRALWRTVRLWVDILPAVTLSETTLQFVVSASPLNALTELDTDRVELVEAMTEEAQRAVDSRAAARRRTDAVA